MVGQWTSQVRKIVGIQIGSRQVALMRVMLCLTLCVLVGGIAPIAAASHRDTGVPQGGGSTASAALDAQPATYRYTGQPDGTTMVQRSKDGGLTWPTVGMIPELVAQLAVNPANDTVVFARTGASLWRSGNSDVVWARIDSLPGRPLALAFAGSNEPPLDSSSLAPILRASIAAWTVGRPGRLPAARCLPWVRDLSP